MKMNPDTQELARSINKSVLSLATDRPVSSARFYIVEGGRLVARTAIVIRPVTRGESQNEMINNGLLVTRR